MIVGGWGKYSTEKCSLDDGEITCEIQTPILDEYAGFPALFEVVDDFCT